MYLSLNEDKTKLIAAEEQYTGSDYAVSAFNVVYPFDAFKMTIVSDNIVNIAAKNFYITELKIVNIEGKELGYNPDDNVVTKDINDKLPDPYETDIGYFTKAVIIACLKYDKNLPLKRAEHNKKLNIIRSIRKLEAGADISINKATELLSYYGLELKFIFKDEFVPIS